MLALAARGYSSMMNKVVTSLRREYSRLEKELGQVRKALDALGHAGGKKLK